MPLLLCLFKAGKLVSPCNTIAMMLPYSASVTSDSLGWLLAMQFTHLSRTYLAHYELESVVFIIIFIFTPLQPHATHNLSLTCCDS